jgi:hypothetical protein
MRNFILIFILCTLFMPLRSNAGNDAETVCFECSLDDITIENSLISEALIFDVEVISSAVAIPSISDRLRVICRIRSSNEEIKGFVLPDYLKLDGTETRCSEALSVFEFV